MEINYNMALLEKRDKKGVSPIIATVLLIAIVIVLAAIIFLWARAFLSEKAVKGDRAVEVSCGEVEFESEVVENAANCPDLQCVSTSNCVGGITKESAIDINNIGNVPIYGIKVFEWDEGLGSVVAEEPLVGGTITIGKSVFVCLGRDVDIGNSFRVVPKLLAEQDGKRVAYTCPEKDGITVAYAGI